MEQVTYTKEDLEQMSPEKRDEILSTEGAVTHGTGVVRRADQTIKYDDKSKSGQYKENGDQ